MQRRPGQTQKKVSLEWFGSFRCHNGHSFLGGKRGYAGRQGMPNWIRLMLGNCHVQLGKHSIKYTQVHWEKLLTILGNGDHSLKEFIKCKEVFDQNDIQKEIMFKKKDVVIL